ncbi:cupin domain-containing protein [Mesorhizobium sp. M00.F.Ca.ET.216.01.1.1]|uniref:cupin domain-containing protein n=1 Tax=Mesorhizobium sp. M00.F.Ca.ET.216.01.1.1 TaxID=2500528 RepID=UPI000FD89B12|nr:cupin domain-containing protein [Mesorhizobium sp. M00.F.Ca.ET.216.01.1.1]TGQ28269.1 cupin domain-containing protein [Mesorhizobium sp. M00.F.Ca.ET.216.01.1.1]
MSKLTFVDQKNLPEPRRGVPLPERRVEGDPRFLTWDIAQTADGQVQAGVWEVTPGAYRSVKGETFEFCYILSGVSELIEDGFEPRRIAAGDAFVMHPGFTGVWRVIETTRKLWVSRD